jgi:hypothetical protein
MPAGASSAPLHPADLNRGNPFPGKWTMAVFYLLPPRPFLGEQCAGFLQGFFPGLDWDAAARAQLADVFGAALAGRTDVYLVYREDLPPGEAPGRALVEAFGAEVGDEIVEVRPDARPGEVRSRRWRISSSSEGC